jgi:hypothetical protein
VLEGKRGSGRTTRQLLAAPLNAVYICCGSYSINYTKRLCHSLGRSDIRVRPPSWLGDSCRGLRCPVIILDHATKLSEEQSYAFYLMNSRG